MLICQTKYHASFYFINSHAPNALSTCSNIKTNILISEIFYFNFTFILHLHSIYTVYKNLLKF